MVKKKENNHAIIALKILGYIFLTVFIIGTITITSINESKIIKLQEEIDSMPQYECWNKTTENWITLEVRECVEDENYWQGKKCDYSNGASTNYNPETDVVECEDGVNIHEYYDNDILNIAEEKKNCLIKTTKEVCQLNKHDVLLGVNE